MKLDQRDYLVALNGIRGVGPRTIDVLKKRFGQFSSIFFASRDELFQTPGVSQWVADKVSGCDIESFLSRERVIMRREGVRVVTIEEDEYPEQLRNIADPPAILYIKGEIKKEDFFSLAVVGTRKPDQYGKMVTDRLVSKLSCAGFTIVSGLAIGIDALAHKAALEQGGRTIAVLGCGLDVCYPIVNKKIKSDIALHGALVSEFPMGTPPEKMNFPRRNRIISGLTLGTMVVQGALKSGSLITADYALEQGRDVFAVPGSISSPLAKGCHKLIKAGAKLVEEVSDIVEDLPLYAKRPNVMKLAEQPSACLDGLSLSPEDNLLLSFLRTQEMHIDELVEATRMPPEKLLPILTKLELSGVVKQSQGMRFLALL